MRAWIYDGFTINGNVKRSGQMNFDPFNDRTSRNIRNGMSSVFAEAIRSKAPEIYRSLARRLLETLPPGGCADFVEDRLRRYDRAYSRIEDLEDFGMFDSAIVLWNHGLYFEFHEYLEEIWQSSSGKLREALKGLIQAAGFFIHMERGRREAAMRLGAKAARLISKNRESIRFITNVNVLLERLASGDFDPVVLETHFFDCSDQERSGKKCLH